MDPSSTVPNLGASGAIAAVMGAFLITYPRDRIRTVVLLGYFARVTFIPAVILVGLWFLTQLFSEIGALTQVQSGGVAYMAHVGGFVFGAATVRDVVIGMSDGLTVPFALAAGLAEIAAGSIAMGLGGYLAAATAFAIARLIG
jgi:hypothetical protein